MKRCSYTLQIGETLRHGVGSIPLIPAAFATCTSASLGKFRECLEYDKSLASKSFPVIIKHLTAPCNIVQMLTVSKTDAQIKLLPIVSP
jgi:hypothetical protein